MPVDASTRNSFENLLAYLRQVFPNREVISSSEFRKFLNVSLSTDQRMRALGMYPATIALPGQMKDNRILLIELAAWLEQGGCPKDNIVRKKRCRGSDTWKKNHPKQADGEPSVEMVYPEAEVNLAKSEETDPRVCPA